MLGFTRVSALLGELKPRKSSLLCAISFGLPFNPTYSLLWHSTGDRRGRYSEIAPTSDFRWISVQPNLRIGKLYLAAGQKVALTEKWDCANIL